MQNIRSVAWVAQCAATASTEESDTQTENKVDLCCS